jgi:hypothetical protein
MKNQTKVTIFLLALTASISASANTHAPDMSKSVIHTTVQQGIDFTLDALSFELTTLKAPIAPISTINSKTNNVKETADTARNNLKRKAKLNQTS